MAWRQAGASFPHQEPSPHGRRRRLPLILATGVVVRNANGSFTVRSQSSRGQSYIVDGEGACHCPDAEKGQLQCKHVIATWIWRKARRQLEAQLAGEGNGQYPTTTPPVETPIAEAHTADVPARIPVQFFVELHGKQFITFGGLLAMAHDKGLRRLSARFISVTPELALAEAIAEFANGLTCSEAADATPKNVHERIRPHFPRLALTRAKARALRDALNISMVAVEELES
jgi:hypothetical protein